MHRIPAIAVIMIASLLALGCSTSGAAGKGAAGAEGPREARLASYPESDYLRAVGSGQSEPEARNRAVSELTRIFVSKVKSEAVDTVKSVILDRKDESLEESLYSRIQIVSDLELEGVEVPEVWKERAAYYAIAVLERQKAARGFRSVIEDLDSRIEGNLNTASASGSQLIKYRALKGVTSLWAERAVYVSRLNVLGFGATSASEYNVRTAMKEMEELKGSMRVFLDISGGGTLVAGVAEALGREGLVLSPDRGGAHVVIKGRVETQKLDMDAKDWVYARATAALSVTDAVTGESVGEVSENVRSAHVSYNEAAGKAQRKLTPVVAESIIRILNE